MQAQGEESLLLEDLFTHNVWEHEEHGLIIRTKDQAVKVHDLLSNFESLEMTLTFGNNKKQANFHCCKLKWPRDPAAYILISLKDVYRALGLTQYNGKSWRWINSGYNAWVTMMQSIGLRAHLVPSTRMHTEASFNELVSLNVSK